MLKKIVLLLLAACLYQRGITQTDTSRVNNLNASAWSMRSSNLDSAMALSNKALEILNSIPSSETFANHWKEKALAKTCYYLGIFFSYKGDNAMAEDHFTKALKISNDIDYDAGRALANGGFGILYLNRGNFTKALDHFLNALRIDEKNKNREGISVDFANIGNIYDARHDYARALEYYTRALKINEELGDKKRIGIQLGNIGNIFFQQGDLAKALEYYNRALNLARETGNRQGVSIMLNNIASVYQDQGRYHQALDHYQQAMELSHIQGNKDALATYIGNIGTVYTLMKDYKKAEDYLLRALKMAEELESIEAIKELEGAVSNLYSEWGKDKLALEHYKKYAAAQDSVYNNLNTEKLVRAEMSYEYEKKRAWEQSQHEKDIIEFEAEKKLQSQLRLFLLIVIGMILVLLVFVKRAYDNKKRIAGFLESEAQRKEVMLQEVHHRINNNLQIISSLLTLQANSAKDERLYEYLQQSLNRIQALSTLHELLFEANTPLEINMRDYLDKVLDFHREVLHTKTTGVQLNMHVESVTFPTNTAVPIAIIVNELITNSIKYAFDAADKGNISITLKKADNTEQWSLQVSDTGKGLPPDSGEKKESLGLRLVNIMARQMGGTLTKSNSPGASFNVIFSISN